MVEAERLWPLRKTKFQTAFRYQYVVSKTELDISFFQTVTLREWHIAYGAALPFHYIHDSRGEWIGVILGIAVSRNGLIQEKLNLELDASDPSFFEAFEVLLKDFAGRYAIFLSTVAGTRYYCDPVGMIGAVYEKKHQRIASSPLLTIDREVIPNPRFDNEKMKESKGKYSLFHTRDAHIRRLNPNCYLDMKTFKETRFWPRDEVFAAPRNEYLEVMDEIVATTKFNIGQIAGAYPTALPISAGQDSRLLATMAGSEIDKVDQIYTHINNWINTVDADIGAMLAKNLNRDHQIHTKGDHSVNRRELKSLNQMFSIAVGYPTTVPEEYANGNVKSIIKDAVILRGHQTDLLRAVFVRKKKSQWTDFDWQIKRLLILPRGQFNMELANNFRPDYKRWYDSLPKNAKDKSVDFMFLEIYYSSTIGAIFPGLWNNFYMSPFNSRRLIELSLKFKERFRQKSLPVFCITQLQNPKVAAIYYDFEYLHKSCKGDKKLSKQKADMRSIKTNALIKELKILSQK